MNANHRWTSGTFSPESTRPDVSELCNGSSERSGFEDLVSRRNKSEADPDGLTVTAEDDGSLPSSSVEDEDRFAPEIQQAYRIFQSFLSEKHKSTTDSFWRPLCPASQGDQMCFKTIDDKFVNGEYESITAFVADFRLMLESCYRVHGVHHWMSKQAQKLEVILEQKLTLLPRTLREKTTLAVTSGGRFGTEDEKAPAGMSTRRRSVPRNLAAITVGGSESIMVQALRLEELQRVKEEKRQREQEKKEAEEVSAQELEEWENSLLSLAEPWSVHRMWELPAIGHFLCLAQTALNLPEIVFYELERCLLVPRCSSFLSKVMTSLLCPSHKRSTLHRRPTLPYRKWEAELRLKVQYWYRSIGRAEDQVSRAEQLGLSHKFFWTVGEENPLEETPFHLLPFNQRVWLLKGLCDHVYETQKDVQDAVLGQPIHECRESILGYDGRENAYIHFPHFCGADLRIYCQSPCLPMEFPLLSFSVQRSEVSDVKEEEVNNVDGVKLKNNSTDSTEVCGWGHKEDSSHDREEVSEKCSSSIPSQYTEASVSVQQIELNKEESESSDVEPCLRVGNSCYKGKSQALTLEHPCKECSETSAHRCSHCQIWNHIQPEINRQRRDDSTKETHTKRKKRKKKSELNVRKTNTRKLNMKNKRVKKHLQRIKKHKLRKVFDPKRRSGSLLLPLEPSFQLVCSSLDDLRRLISRTEDELDEINSTKKKSGRRPHKRSTVKELHITLIRLLNELLPWEPKLVKAFQKNRVRLKKECDDFRKHPEYENFIREQLDTADTEDGLCKDVLLSSQKTRELQEDIRSMNEDSDIADHINQLVNHKSRSEVMMSGNETGPFTRSSKRRHTINEDMRTLKKSKPETRTLSVSDETTVNTQAFERCSVLSDCMKSVQETYKPIQALLAKSVGNKVTLINHPSAADLTSTPSVQPSATFTATSHSHPFSTTTTETSDSTGPLVYKTAGGVGLLRRINKSHDKSEDKLTQQVVILPSNLLIQSTEMKTPLLKDIVDIKTPPATVLPTLRTLPTAESKTTTEPTTSPTPDTKQELRTVCIRDSQSILVTTRGGNTGVVKVQMSDKNRTATLPHSPVFTISPQLQAFLMSNASKSTSQTVPDTLSTGYLPPINTLCSDGKETSDRACSKSTNQSNESLLRTLKDVQNSVSKCIVKAPQQTSDQKVFLQNTSATKIAATSVAYTAPGSKVMFVNHPSVSHNSTPVIPQTASSSVVSVSSSPALQALKVIPSTSVPVMNIQNFSLPGLTSQILSTHKNTSPVTTVFTKTQPVTSASSVLQMDERRKRRNESNDSALKISADGKTFTFSSLGTGHMASSELLCVVKDTSTSPVLNVLNKTSSLAVGSSSSDLLSSLSGSLINKDTTNSSRCTLPSSINMTPVTSTQTQTSSPVVRSVQEKIVINTSAPLAPGTQLVINNTRFILPPQGLGAGSHVLLISSPCPGVSQESCVRGLNVSQQSQVRLPSPTTSRVRSSLLSHAAVSSEPSLAHVGRLPVFGKGLMVQQSPSVSSCSLPQGRLLSTTSGTILQSSQTQSVPSVLSQNALMSSTVSRMSIGCPNTSLVTPVVNVPSSKPSCQPIRALHSGTIGKTVVLPQQTQTQSPSALQITNNSKLMLSPDGAVLNLIQTSASPDSHQQNQ